MPGAGSARGRPANRSTLRLVQHHPKSAAAEDQSFDRTGIFLSKRAIEASKARNQPHHRLSHSHTKSGTYLVVVAEGLKNASGQALVDESSAPDALDTNASPRQHLLAQELTRRFKDDPDTKQLMMREKLYVEGIQELPEIRAVTLGHLVRCGRSSVCDVNFGKEVGASAVILLTSGLSGVTVTGLRHGKIEYIPTRRSDQTTLC